MLKLEKISKSLFLAENLDNPDKAPTRDGYGKALLELGKTNSNVVALDADLSGSTRSNWFAKEFPDRFFNAGIAEQNMVAMAAGLALEGKIPFASTFAVFLPGRSYDQIRTSVCYPKINVKFGASHAGLSVGEDGASHQMIEDIALTTSIPNLIVFVPCDFDQTKKSVFEAAKIDGPVFIRFGRPKLPKITTEKTPFETGKAQTFREGSDVTIIACGGMVHLALQAAFELSKENIEAAVINMHTLKPLDNNAIIEAAKNTNAIVTAEEHHLTGGLGSLIASVLAKNYPVPVEMVGVGDTFGESGTQNDLFKKYHLTKDDIINSVKKVIKRK